MIKKIFFVILLILIPATVFASTPESPTGFPEGAVLQQEGTFIRYLMRNGQKWRILTPYTFKELGVAQKDVIKTTKAVLKNIPDGETFRISPPKIKEMFSMHEHFRADGDMKHYLDIAGKLGIKITVFVGTGGAPDNKGYKEHTAALLKEQKKSPDRVIAFCAIDEADPKAPEIFKQCLKDGGKGLKILGGHPDFYDVPLNNDVMRQSFKIAQDADVPVLIHVSIITLPKAKEEIISLLDEFPNVRVNFAHYCSAIMTSIDLAQCEYFLDRYPNLYIDMSMGGGIERYFKFMTQNITPIKDFVLKYQDRIFYGTDIIVAGGKSPTEDSKWLRGRIMCDLSLHQEKWYKCPTMNNKGAYSLLPGFNLPEEVLRKIYIENPKKFLKL